VLRQGPCIFLVHPQVNPQCPHKGAAPDPKQRKIKTLRHGSWQVGQQIQKEREQCQLNPANDSPQQLRHKLDQRLSPSDQVAVSLTNFRLNTKPIVWKNKAQ
jgi:hypothetical protein